MSLDIDNKVYRNIQEQVAYNSTNIKKIADYIDGLDVQDSVIVLESLSPLNSEQMKVAEQPLAFIVYDEAVYLKTKEDAAYYYFEKMLKMELGTYVTLSSAVIQVTKLNGATGITASSVVTYAKGQIDTLLAGKVDTATLASYSTLSYVNTELAKKADLTGASFSGPITSPSIIQTMTGFEFSEQVNENVTITLAYASISQNGNKITMVIAGSFTSTAGKTRINIGSFKVPNAVYNNLFPILSTIIQMGSILLNTDEANQTQYPCNVIKDSGNYVRVQIRPAAAITAGTYYFRYEGTFLLSENMVPVGE